MNLKYGACECDLSFSIEVYFDICNKIADFIDEAFQLQIEKRRKKSTSIRRRADKIEKAMEVQQTKSVTVTILHNATIITTMDPDARFFRNGGVVIERDAIVWYGTVRVRFRTNLDDLTQIFRVLLNEP
ncbi:hypothetical protein CerSpe_023260 [Prunus speciosa]